MDNSGKKKRLHLKKLLIYIILTSFMIVSYFLYYLYLDEKIKPVVEGRIYRSAQLSETSLEKLIREKGIKTIINLRGNFKNDRWHIREVEVSRKHNVRHHDMRIHPSELPEYLRTKKILEILSTSEKPVLIHCLHGIDRTGMVSALALAIEKDPPLSELKKQFSWRNGVLPFFNSIGPYFFSKYEQWLERTQKVHSKDNLMCWFKHEYTDNRSNLEFWIDHINGVRYNERYITLDHIPGKIIIEGWVFNSRSNLPANDLFVVVDGKPFRADPVINRPDVARYFNLGEEYYENFKIGWKVEFENDTLAGGCHKIYLRTANDGSGITDIPTGNIFCFQK